MKSIQVVRQRAPPVPARALPSSPVDLRTRYAPTLCSRSSPASALGPGASCKVHQQCLSLRAMSLGSVRVRAGARTASLPLSTPYLRDTALSAWACASEPLLSVLGVVLGVETRAGIAGSRAVSKGKFLRVWFF